MKTRVKRREKRMTKRRTMRGTKRTKKRRTKRRTESVSSRRPSASSPSVATRSSAVLLLNVCSLRTRSTSTATSVRPPSATLMRMIRMTRSSDATSSTRRCLSGLAASLSAKRQVFSGATSTCMLVPCAPPMEMVWSWPFSPTMSVHGTPTRRPFLMFTTTPMMRTTNTTSTTLLMLRVSSRVPSLRSCLAWRRSMTIQTKMMTMPRMRTRR
mmetsp:Transcript_26774/g.64248  ORF Transcript_26774/g.64248 Transcript_26774/m.64248 type:complete len:212 (-) Transcript_26774:669-1304(-)